MAKGIEELVQLSLAHARVEVSDIERRSAEPVSVRALLGVLPALRRCRSLLLFFHSWGSWSLRSGSCRCLVGGGHDVFFRVFFSFFFLLVVMKRLKVLQVKQTMKQLPIFIFIFSFFFFFFVSIPQSKQFREGRGTKQVFEVQRFFSQLLPNKRVSLSSLLFSSLSLSLFSSSFLRRRKIHDFFGLAFSMRFLHAGGGKGRANKRKKKKLEKERRRKRFSLFFPLETHFTGSVDFAL